MSEQKLLKRMTSHFVEPYSPISFIYSQPEGAQLVSLRTSAQLRHFEKLGIKARAKK